MVQSATGSVGVLPAAVDVFGELTGARKMVDLLHHGKIHYGNGQVEARVSG